MRRFKFNLESVLTIREKALNDARIQLASVMNIYNRQKDVLDEMNFELIRIKNECENYLQQINFNSEVIANYNAFAYKLAQDIKTQEKIIEETEKELKKLQEAARLLYIKVKSLENLKQKQIEQYNKELLQEEFKEIDDIVNSKRKAV